jgi:hypothetical protein
MLPQLLIRSSSIPQIKADIARVREETRRDLSRLPPPASNALSEALRMIADFQRVVEKEVDGTTSKHGLIQKIRAHENQFRRDLRGTAPLFVPFNAADKFARVPIIDFLAEEERDLGQHAFTQLIYLDEVQERAKECVRHSSNYTYIKPLIMYTACSAVSRQFPNHVPFEVQREYIVQSIQLWATPAQKLFAAVRATLEAHFDPIIDAHFLKFPRLANAVRYVISWQDYNEYSFTWLISVACSTTAGLTVANVLQNKSTGSCKWKPWPRIP